jgi:hypothetical protein
MVGYYRLRESSLLHCVVGFRDPSNLLSSGYREVEFYSEVGLPGYDPDIAAPM